MELKAANYEFRGAYMSSLLILLLIICLYWFISKSTKISQEYKTYLIFAAVLYVLIVGIATFWMYLKVEDLGSVGFPLGVISAWTIGSVLIIIYSIVIMFFKKLEHKRWLFILVIFLCNMIIFPFVIMVVVDVPAVLIQKYRIENLGYAEKAETKKLEKQKGKIELLGQKALAEYELTDSFLNGNRHMKVYINDSMDQLIVLGKHPGSDGTIDFGYESEISQNGMDEFGKIEIRSSTHDEISEVIYTPYNIYIIDNDGCILNFDSPIYFGNIFTDIGETYLLSFIDKLEKIDEKIDSEGDIHRLYVMANNNKSMYLIKWAYGSIASMEDTKHGSDFEVDRYYINEEFEIEER